MVHTAAALPLCTRGEIFSTEVDGTKNVLIESSLSKVKRFVHISSTAVYGIPSHPNIIETDTLSGVGEYGEAKIAAEYLCRQYASDNMAVAILRPTSFLGPERLGVFEIL